VSVHQNGAAKIVPHSSTTLASMPDIAAGAGTLGKLRAAEKTGIKYKVSDRQNQNNSK
jgi:hypothetical protein